MKKIIFLIVCLFSTYTIMADEGPAKVNTGEQAPVFTYYDQGTKHSLSEFKGKVVLINFFATWCPPCRKELPHIESEIWGKYKNNPKFKMLTFGRGHSEQELKTFAEQTQFTFPLFADKDRKVFDLYSKQGIPRCFLLDKNGNILYQTSGFEEENFKKLVSILDQLLK